MNNRLEDLREENDLKIIDLAKILGVSDSVYSRWEKGKNFIPTRRLYQLAVYYNTSVNYVLKLTNKRKVFNANKDLSLEKSAERVKEIRTDLGYTLRDMAKVLNTSNSTYSAYETGKVLILSAFLIQLSTKYNYSADWILGLSEEKYLDQKKY